MDTKDYMEVSYGKSVYGQDEIDAVVNTMKKTTQMGYHVAEFEKRVAELFNKKYGIMVNSGSSALLLAMKILQLPNGSEVITPALTFSTTVGSLLFNNLKPVFVDAKSGTYNIDEDKIEAKITNKTKAMLVPNLLGNFPDWDKLHDIAKKHGLITIEDSADTLGSTLKGRSTGSRTHISTTSFYGSHVINCAGNGGMLCVNEEGLRDRAKLLRSWGRDSSLYQDSENIEHRFDVKLEGIVYDKKFIFSEIGFNLEPSEIGASFGLVQLGKLQDNIEKRNKWYSQQLEFFKTYEDWFILPRQIENSYTPWLAFPLTVKKTAPFTRTDMQIFFEKSGIQTRSIFTGNILRQPGFKNIDCTGEADEFEVADEVMTGGILLACHHGLVQEMMDHIHGTFQRFIKKYI